MRETNVVGTKAACSGGRGANGIPRVLVIEDVDTTRRRMCSALRAGGYQVEEATNGADGLRLLSATSSCFDAILLDLVLPQLNGWEFREAQLRQPQLASIPTIIVTVRPLREPDRYALRARTVIQKPFEDDALVAMVASACASSDGDARSAAAVAAPRSGASRPATGELFWSRRGEVACSAHAPAIASERWVDERWTVIPRGAGRDRLVYQCQHCSGIGPIRHRSTPGFSSMPELPMNTLPSEQGPLCPRCQQIMTATERAPKCHDDPVTPQADGADTPPRPLPVWRCAICGIDRARFD